MECSLSSFVGSRSAAASFLRAGVAGSNRGDCQESSSSCFTSELDRTFQALIAGVSLVELLCATSDN